MCIVIAPFVIACIMIACDVLTGLLKGASQGELSSSTMRQGMFHKSAEIALLLISAVIGEIKCFWSDFPINFEGVYVAVCVYIIIMELISSLENISVINPEMNLERLKGLFGVTDDSDVPVIQRGEVKEDFEFASETAAGDDEKDGVA